MLYHSNAVLMETFKVSRADTGCSSLFEKVPTVAFGSNTYNSQNERG